MHPFLSHVSTKTVAALMAGIGIALLPAYTQASRADDGGARRTVERTRTLELPDGRVLTVTAVLDPRRVDPEVAMDELVPGSVPQSQGGGASAAFAIFDTWGKGDLPVTMRYSQVGAPAAEGVNTAGLVEAALATWDGAGSGMRFVDGGRTTATTSLCDNPSGGGDGVNTIQWRTSLRDGWLGSTCTIASGQIDGRYRIVEADIVFSSEWNWSFGDATAADAYDWRSTLLHELGHVAGLSHSEAEGSVMLASLGLGVQRRTPSQDDIAGLRALYGLAPQPTPAPQVPARPPGLTRRVAAAGLARGN